MGQALDVMLLMTFLPPGLFSKLADFLRETPLILWFAWTVFLDALEVGTT